MDRDLLFGEGDGSFSGWSKAKAALVRRIAASQNFAAEVRPSGSTTATDWTLHDIRRTVATRMADFGTSPHVIEALLNHVSGTRAGVAGVYNRALYAAEKRAALTLWADHVAVITDASPKIVPFKPA